MTICKNCGVELEDNMNYCPLCGDPVVDENVANQEEVKLRKIERQQRLLSDIEKLNQIQKRKLIWEVISIILGSLIIVTLSLNFFMNREITWSKYTAIAFLFLFAYVSIFLFWHKRLVITLLSVFFTTFALMLLLDGLNGTINWSVGLGLPILLATVIVASALIVVIRISKRKGFNLVTYAFISLGLLAICIDGILSYYFRRNVDLSWGSIVFTSILPIAAILLFMHFRLRKSVDLKKFFHI